VDIFATITSASVPVNGLPDPPEIRIRDDANTVVQAFTAMTDLSADGKYLFAFVIPDAARSYTFLVDADPLVSGQVPTADRFYSGGFSGEADIMATNIGIGANLAAIDALRQFIEGGRDIDFVGSDTNGWQRIERDIGGTLIRRYNLFDENGARINETVASFIGRQGMISSEVAI